MRWSLLLALGMLVVFAGRASAQPVPTTVEADVITYDAIQQVVTAQGHVRVTFRRYRLTADAARMDLRTGIVTARGRVLLVDTEGRQLRGTALTYNSRTEEGVLEPVEGHFEKRVYLRGRRLDATPALLVAHEATVTTCDPAQPLFRVVARRIEIVPDQEVVAHDASLYLGNRRLVTLPRYEVSLRPPEVRTQFPGFGANAAEGFWADYRFRLRVGPATGRVHVRAGTVAGVAGLVTLASRAPGYTASFRLGRTQTVDDRPSFDGLRYDVAEFQVTTPGRRIARLPLSWTATVAGGWYGEVATGVSTTRLDSQVRIATDTFPMGERVGVAASAGIRLSAYGTGAVRTVASYGATLTYRLDPFTTASLGYGRDVVRGSTPLQIDVVDPADTVSLGLARVVPDRYRASVGAAWNAAVPETKYSAAASVIVSPRWELGLAVVYSTRLAAFEDIDYTVRWVCDCVDVVVGYRQMRRQLVLEVGLFGFPERGDPFVPRTPLPMRTFEPQP
ncbi:MAG: hypothetical protein QN203_12875 [Armatimonadota bacterium]|nr:hypothetical protein [Armatimonadota bacterium]